MKSRRAAAGVGPQLTGSQDAIPLSSHSKTVRIRSAAIGSDAPLGILTLYLLQEAQQAGRDGLVLVCDEERRAERLGALIHAFDPAVEVLVLPSPGPAFEDLEPAREIAGRRASVLRRLAQPSATVVLIGTVEA